MRTEAGRLAIVAAFRASPAAHMMASNPSAALARAGPS